MASTTKRKSGAEAFKLNGKGTQFRLVDFWQWSVSDLVSNLTRGRLAEYIVAKACDVPTDGIRDEWQAFDLVTHDGVKIEVKSAAYVQSWKQKAPSVIRFDCRETLGWSSEKGCFDSSAKRQADVYVFAVLAHRDPATLDPLNLDQWIFYVVGAEILTQKKRRSLGLSSVRKLAGPPVQFHEVGITVARIGLRLPPDVGDLVEVGADGIHRMAPPGRSVFD